MSAYRSRYAGVVANSYQSDLDENGNEKAMHTKPYRKKTGEVPDLALVRRQLLVGAVPNEWLLLIGDVREHELPEEVAGRLRPFNILGILIGSERRGGVLQDLEAPLVEEKGAELAGVEAPLRTLAMGEGNAENDEKRSTHSRHAAPRGVANADLTESNRTEARVKELIAHAFEKLNPMGIAVAVDLLPQFRINCFSEVC